MAETTSTCSTCGSSMQVNQRFCPVCKSPREHVEKQLRSAAQMTGDDYETLLVRARAQEAEKLESSKPSQSWTNSKTQVQDSGDSQSTRNLILLLLCAVGVIAGSLGPWATVWIITVNGTSGDGMISLVLGGLAGGITAMGLVRPDLSRGQYVVVLLCFVGAGGLGIYHWNNLDDLVSRSDFTAQVGWGLQLMVVAAILGAIGSLVTIGNYNAIGTNNGPSNGWDMEDWNRWAEDKSLKQLEDQYVRAHGRKSSPEYLHWLEDKIEEHPNAQDDLK